MLDTRVRSETFWKAYNPQVIGEGSPFNDMDADVVFVMDSSECTAQPMYLHD